MTICHIPPSDSRVVLLMLCEGALRNIQTGSKEHNEIYFNQLISMFEWMKHCGGYPKEKDTVGTEDVNRIIINAADETGLDLYYDEIRDLFVILNDETLIHTERYGARAILVTFLQRVIEDLNRVIKG